MSSSARRCSLTDEPRPRSSDQAATPEGHTKEEPAASELGQPGTPGAGMSAAVPHSADAEDEVAHHATDSHMDTHTALSDDDHGHSVMALGPVDWGKWAYALVGGLFGLIVVAAFWVSLNQA